jgi:hypothetical protein
MKSWVDSLDVAAVEERLRQIEFEIETLGSERDWLMEGLTFKQRWSKAHSAETPSPPARRAVPEAHFPLDGGPPIQNKTEGLLRVLGSDPDREWTAAEISSEMIPRGWMDDSSGDMATLMATLSRLVAEGRIHRPQRGRYRLSPP